MLFVTGDSYSEAGSSFVVMIIECDLAAPPELEPLLTDLPLEPVEDDELLELLTRDGDAEREADVDVGADAAGEAALEFEMALLRSFMR